MMVYQLYWVVVDIVVPVYILSQWNDKRKPNHQKYPVEIPSSNTDFFFCANLTNLQKSEPSEISEWGKTGRSSTTTPSFYFFPLQTCFKFSSSSCQNESCVSSTRMTFLQRTASCHLKISGTRLHFLISYFDIWRVIIKTLCRKRSSLSTLFLSRNYFCLT